MPLWIPVTIFAAFAQNLRFMLQRKLKVSGLSAGGATFARFLFSFPIIALIAALYAQGTGQPLPRPTAAFWPPALIGGLGQVLATMCVVALFSERSFAIGITFKKTEVMLTALMGFLVLNETLAPLALVAIVVGFAGVIALSDPPDAAGGWRRLMNRGAALGLASGALFGVSAIGYRAASLSLGVSDPFLSASVTLSLVTLWQTLILGLWLACRETGEIRRVLSSWRVSVLVGLTSLLGSLAWFTAFTLQNAAMVKALGQIELVFSFLATHFVFGEATTRREAMGVGLIVLSVLILILSL